MTISTRYITANFTYAETIVSEVAARRGISNQYPPELADDVLFAATRMQYIRDKLQRAIHVNSWYRAPKVNALVGGSETSAHLTGHAIDFNVAGLVPLEACKRIIRLGVEDETFKWDQLIWEYGSWVHISFDPRMRGQVFHYKTGVKGAIAGLPNG